MRDLLNTIIANRYTLTSAILFSWGLCSMLLNQNLIKKVIGFNIMDAATFLFLATRGYMDGRTAAILTDGGADITRYVNPIPAGLVLTGIVVSVSVSAFSLALIQRLYGYYGTVNTRQLLQKIREKEASETA